MMRYPLALLLLCACLWAAPADAASSLTKRNNDASLGPPSARMNALRGYSHPKRPPRTSRQHRARTRP